MPAFNKKEGMTLRNERKQEIKEFAQTVKVGKNTITGTWAVIITVLAVAMSLFHMYFNSYGMISSINLRTTHLAFVLCLVFLMFPIKKGMQREKPPIYDILLAIAGIFISYYMAYKYAQFSVGTTTAGQLDYIIGAVGILLIFEAVRRSAGMPLVILSAIFLVYARWGNLAPGSFRIVPFSTNRILYQIFYTETGIFGAVMGVSATFIFLFILFGAFLGENGSSEFFNDLSLAAAGHRPGGPGKVAILASALMGSISGSAVANVATTGTITIPLMKKVGYKPEFAAAVEAVSSSGGSIMPPVMASAAFIMAEMLGVAYSRIILAALIPAVMYYFSVWVMLHLEAKKLHLEGLPKDQLPVFRDIIKTRGHLALPLLALIFMLVSGFTPLFAGFWGIILTIVISAIKKETRLSFKGLLASFREGAFASITAAATCAIVGVIVGITSMTGLGTMIASNIIDLAGGNLFFALILTMVACLILGMGLPTAACYITAAVVATPAIITLGIPPIAAHLFVLYYAILSNLTPPVAMASFTAAGIADCKPTKVAFVGLRLGIAGFIVPIIFAYSPILLFEGSFTILEIVLATTTSIVGVIALAAGSERFLFVKANIIETLLFLAASILMIVPGFSTDIMGAALLAIAAFTQLAKKKKLDKEAVTAQ